eukprot:768781-Hanusia_phi.AAC.9
MRCKHASYIPHTPLAFSQDPCRVVDVALTVVLPLRKSCTSVSHTHTHRGGGTDVAPWSLPRP